jgi:hypothetical protein
MDQGIHGRDVPPSQRRCEESDRRLRSRNDAISIQLIPSESADPWASTSSGKWRSTVSGTISAIGTRAEKGVLAGSLAIAAMDTLLYVRYRRSGGHESPFRWEFSAHVRSWDDASAPGLVGKRLVEGVLGHEVPDTWARPIQNAMSPRRSSSLRRDGHL